MTADDIVHIFWTGGWDSSFRVLDLVLAQKATVQPHYILALDRQRYKAEIAAMTRIRQEISSLDPDAAGRLLPTRITLLADIPRDDQITETLTEIHRRRELSSQYEFLTRYAIAMDVTGIEVGFVQEGHSYFTADDLEPVMAANGSPSWRLPVDHGNPDWLLFDRFTFPMVDLTKPELGELAWERGFRNLLELTWFCQFPTRGRPCGYCGLCRDTIAAGMIERFPVSARLRYRFWKPFYVARVIREYPGLVLQRVISPKDRFKIREFGRTR